MFFGSIPFSAAAFADSGLESTNVTVAVTGQGLTLTLDNDYVVQKIHHVNGTSLTTTLNSVIPEARVHETGVQADFVTGTPTVAGNATVVISGSGTGSTVTLGSVAGAVVPIITGFSLSANTSGVQSVTGTSSLILNGNNLTTSTNTVGVGYALEVTGNSLTSTVNSVQLDLKVSVTGQVLSSSVNSVQPQLLPNITGNSLTSSVNSVALELSPVAAVSGNALTSAVNNLSVFTFSDTDDTTTATIGTTTSTAGAGGASWSEVSTAGAGKIEGEAA